MSDVVDFDRMKEAMSHLQIMQKAGIQIGERLAREGGDVGAAVEATYAYTLTEYPTLTNPILRKTLHDGMRDGAGLATPADYVRWKP